MQSARKENKRLKMKGKKNFQCGKAFFSFFAFRKRRKGEKKVRVGGAAEEVLTLFERCNRRTIIILLGLYFSVFSFFRFVFWGEKCGSWNIGRVQVAVNERQMENPAEARATPAKHLWRPCNSRKREGGRSRLKLTIRKRNHRYEIDPFVAGQNNVLMFLEYRISTFGIKIILFILSPITSVRTVFFFMIEHGPVDLFVASSIDYLWSNIKLMIVVFEIHYSPITYHDRLVCRAQSSSTVCTV